MTCPLFVELCAGTAAVSLRLARARARPPVSRMGAKTGYADAILGLAGLAPGQGAGHYLWCEPDPGCRLLLEAYRDAALAKAAADIIRGWAGEDPRALWERLRAEGPPRLPEVSPGGLPFAHEVARWTYITARRHQGEGGYAPESYDDPNRNGWPGSGPPRAALAQRVEDAVVDAHEVARWAWVQRRSANGKGADYKDGEGTHKIAPDAPAPGMRGLPSLAATIAPDAREVDPREVARWGILGQWSFRRGSPASGFNPGAVEERPVCADGHRREARTVADEARLWERLAGDLPATILPDAHAADPGPALPAGTVALFDPPYEGTTPYANDLPRADVVALARRWAAAGALVMVCEAEPIPELLADGWVYRDIAHARMGQKRTFSRQQREVVTMSRPPVHVPAEQVGLFGGGR